VTKNASFAKTVRLATAADKPTKLAPILHCTAA
jgi:hypothetical protein